MKIKCEYIKIKFFHLFHVPIIYFCSIDPNLMSSVYCTAMEHGTEDDWDFLWEKYKKSVLPSIKYEIIKILGCTKNINNLNK